jgi:hypothetical protein
MLITITAVYSGVIRQSVLTVNPASLASVNIAASAVGGTVTVTGNTVTLLGQAPAGGATVHLSSSDPAAVVPASVVVAAGQSVSPAFTISTTLVGVSKTVTITATYNGVSKTDTLIVNPLVVSAVTLSPSAVAGGTSAKSNRVVLNAAAPAGRR